MIEPEEEEMSTYYGTSKEYEEGEFICKTCSRIFTTEYELLNHNHKPLDIPMVSDKSEVDTRFIYEGKVEVSSPSSGALRYEKFSGKIGYFQKKKVD